MIRVIVPLVAATMLIGPAAAQIVPTPRATALPVTATSRPFLAARRSLLPVDLAARGYIEQEFLLSGQASIYDWATSAAPDPTVQVRAPNVPYATRFLLRRPADAKRFSGRVIVELLNPADGFDVAPLWGLSYEHVLRSGDVYVGLTVHPAALAALKKFDSQRYAQVSFAYQQGPDCVVAPAGPGVDPLPDSESGLAWDAIAQLGALLRSSSRDNPLGRPAQQVLAGGYAQSGGYLITYINALHHRLRLGDRSPIYDGFLEVAGASAPAPLSQCGAALVAEDPRRRLGAHDVPVIQVSTQSDFPFTSALPGSGDVAQDRSRHYALPGVGQQGPWPAGRPGDADLRGIELERFDPGEQCDATATNLVANPSYHALWTWLQRWAALPLDPAAAPPPSRFLEVNDAGHAVRDAQGNLRGGLRLPHLDAPLAAYSGDSPTASQDVRVQRLCRLSGSMRPFDASALQSLYRNRADYVRQFNAATEALVREGSLLDVDAAALRTQAARASFPP